MVATNVLLGQGSYHLSLFFLCGQGARSASRAQQHRHKHRETGSNNKVLMKGAKKEHLGGKGNRVQGRRAEPWHLDLPPNARILRLSSSQ